LELDSNQEKIKKIIESIKERKNENTKKS